MKHPIKVLIQFLALVAGLSFSQIAHAQYPYYQQVLLNERVGFGQNATGGAGGEVYWVTTLEDHLNTPGTLRYGLEQDDNHRWVMFKVSGTIDLIHGAIQVRSNKTVDGRGASITIKRHGFYIGTHIGETLVGSRNVIVENLTFFDGQNPDLDAIMIQQGAGDVWVDHCTFTKWPHNALNVWEPHESVYSDVTISWCRFTPYPGTTHTAVLLAHDLNKPGPDYGENTRVTLHHNFFDRVVQRSPFARKARVHAFNNYLFNWGLYGMASGGFAHLYVENNIFDAGEDKDAVIFQGGGEPNAGYTKNVNNWTNNGASIDENNPNDLVFNPSWHYNYAPFLEAPDPSLRTKIQNYAGATRSSAGFANMSTRAHVQSGQGNLISGMYIIGTGSKKVLVRAIGPSLAPWVPGAMGDPILRIFNSASQQIAYNNNWGETQGAEIQASGLAPSHPSEAAVLITLPAGTSYSAVIDDVGTGIASVEIYDLDPFLTTTSKLVNISSRASVDPNSPPIAGLILDSGMAKVIIRGIGPSLGNYGIQSPISDPNLTLYDANGAQIAFNNNWQDTQGALIQQTGFQPSDGREAAILVELASGTYTVVLRDNYNHWGIGSIEVYKL